MKKSLGILLPCYNETEIIEYSIKKLIEVIKDLDLYNCKIVIIDDGSNDNSWQKISNECKKFKNNLIGVRLVQNIGKDKCLIEGIKNFNFDLYITMDVDGEHPFEGIKDLLSMHEKGSSLVLGVRENFNDGLITLFLKKVYYFIFQLINYKKYQSSDFRLFTNKIKETILRQYSNLNYYKPAFDHINLNEEYYFYKSKKNKLKKSSKFNLFSLINYAFSNLTFYNLKLLNFSIFLCLISGFIYLLNILLILFGFSGLILTLLNKIFVLLIISIFLIATLYIKNIYEILLSNNKSKIIEIINKTNISKK